MPRRTTLSSKARKSTSGERVYFIRPKVPVRPQDCQGRPSRAKLVQIFGRRFALAHSSEAGVLLDTCTGTFYQLNRSAMETCKALSAGRAAAGPTLADALGQLDLAYPPARRGFDVVSHARGHEMCWNGRARLRISRDGRKLTLIAPIPKRFSLDRWILMAARYAAWLQGCAILHAAAVSRRGRAMVIFGRSGAGKTTLARTLETCGWSRLADDMLLLSRRKRSLRIVLDGETRILDWAWQSSEKVRSGAKVVDASPLSRIARGHEAEIERLAFLSAKREGAQIRVERISPIEALTRIMASSFGSLAHPDLRLQLLETAIHLVSETAFSLKEPRGLAALRRAVSRQSWI